MSFVRKGVEGNIIVNCSRMIQASFGKRCTCWKNRPFIIEFYLVDYSYSVESLETLPSKKDLSEQYKGILTIMAYVTLAEKLQVRHFSRGKKNILGKSDVMFVSFL